MINHLRRLIWIEDRGWIEENGMIQITKGRSGEMERKEGLAKTAENRVSSAFKFDPRWLNVGMYIPSSVFATDGDRR